MFSRLTRARLVVLVTIPLLLSVAAACTPNQMAVFQSITLTRNSMTCSQAVAAIFPASAQPEMQKIVRRESGGDASAKNRRSSASGCAQLLASHAPLFTHLGYSWGHDRYLAYPNIAVAHELWKQCGWSPWRLTR